METPVNPALIGALNLLTCIVMTEWVMHQPGVNINIRIGVAVLNASASIAALVMMYFLIWGLFWSMPL